jgi:hypothetical protein
MREREVQECVYACTQARTYMCVRLYARACVCACTFRGMWTLGHGLCMGPVLTSPQSPSPSLSARPPPLSTDATPTPRLPCTARSHSRAPR